MLRFEALPVTHLDRAIAIEEAGYPADEAASLESLTYRQHHAGLFYLGTYLCDSDSGTLEAQQLIGFVCGTCAQGLELEDETMSTHDPSPQASTLCIHSVVIDQAHRRKGYATKMLKNYVDHVTKNAPHITVSLLIAKSHLLPFYASCGFELVRLSPVVHGKDPWFECRCDISQRRRLEVCVADAFCLTTGSCAVPFTGNPAAVVVIPPYSLRDIETDEVWFQQVAMEMALSETAFLQRSGEGNSFRLRWFTPTNEVDLCGHATLASAHVLWESGHAAKGEDITFLSASGPLGAKRKPGDSSLIELDFPAEVAKEYPSTSAEYKAVLPQLLEGLGLGEAGSAEVLWVGANRMDVLVEVTASCFAKLQPDLSALAKVETARGVLVTARGTEAEQQQTDESIFRSEVKFDCYSRCFFPKVGVPEDPVTGSAHCAIAPYWVEKLGKSTLRAQQASQRGGDLTLTLVPDAAGGSGRVLIAGLATSTMAGRLGMQ